MVGRQLGVRIRSHRPSEETEARPDQLYGEEECRHPWCELEVPLGLCGLCRSLRLFQNKLIRTGPYAKWKNLPHNDKIRGLYCYCTVVTSMGKSRSLRLA